MSENKKFEREETYEQWLVRLMRDKPGTLETTGAMEDWFAREERRLESNMTITGMINYNLVCARLYLAAEYPEEARESFEIVLMMAEGEEMINLVHAVRDEMKKAGIWQEATGDREP
jgi:hypothetical protein